MSELQLFPAWKQAVQDFLSEFKYGDIVPHTWLEAHFGIPGMAELTTLEVMRQRQFEWLASIESFKHSLLRDHNVCLQSIRGEGYRWVPPCEQTDFATKEFERDAKKVFRTTAQRIKNIRLNELTEDQRRQNMDAAGKLSAIAGMTRKALQ